MSSLVRKSYTTQNKINSQGLLDLAEPEPRSLTGPGGTGCGRWDSWPECGLPRLSPRLALHLSCPQPWLLAREKKKGKKEGGGREGGREGGRGGERREKFFEISATHSSWRWFLAQEYGAT